MAINFFLGLSESYKRKTDQDTLRKREIVAKHLTNKYKAARGRDDEIFRQIREVLTAENISFTDKDYDDEKKLLRGLYSYLRASDEEDRRDALNGILNQAQPIIRLLAQDGITSWSDVKSLSGGVTDEEEEEDERGGSTAIESPVAIRKRAFESLAGETLTATIANLFPALEAIFEENERFKQDIARITDENIDLQAALAENRVLLEMSEAETSSLVDQLRIARERIRDAHRSSIETIATEHPEIPQLINIVEQLKGTGRGRKEERQALESKLPKTFTWRNDTGAILYREPFIRDLLQWNKEEQEKVIRQLGVLAEHGPGHHSLHTRKNEDKIPYTPTPYMSSRGADDLRFSWTKNGELTIHWCWRKGDSRVRQSEA